MTIDHAAEARHLIEAGHGKTPNTAAMNQREAQVHATLALVEQQRIANLIAYVANSEGMADGHKEWLEEELGL